MRATSVKKDIVHELHKPARSNFKRRRVIVKGLNDLFQADLVEMIPYAKENKGYRYILVVIDVFSKYVWALPVKSKSGPDVTSAMSKIFTMSKTRIPRNVQTDLGKEFYNKSFKLLMDRYNINHYSTFSSKKCSVVERVNRTLKNIMWREFNIQGSYKWLQLLPQIVEKYNSTKHRTIGIKPIEVNKSNESKLLASAYNHIKMIDEKIPKFKIDQHVRISKHRGVFAKGYMPNFSTEIFKIKQVKLTNPTTYLLQDQSGEDILGGFYEMELQKVKHPDVYLVEKVLKKKGNNVFVKWLGFNDSHNSWISKDNVE
jgi:hypothetical protein